jgi:hypothetical protein
LSGAVVRGLSAAALAAATAAACNQTPDKFVLLGQRYDAVDDCVEPTSSIDLVQGSDPGLGCPPQCVVTPTGVLYVTTECGSSFPPLDMTSAGGDPQCDAALAALKRMAVCGGGGDDAGDDASDATTDATPEGTEAAPDGGDAQVEGAPPAEAGGDSQQE